MTFELWFVSKTLDRPAEKRRDPACGGVLKFLVVENIEEFGAERQRELIVIEASGLFQRQIEIDCDPDRGSSGEACRRCWSAGRWVRLILRGITRGNDRTARIKDEISGHGTRIALRDANLSEAGDKSIQKSDLPLWDMRSGIRHGKPIGTIHFGKFLLVARLRGPLH